MHHHRKLHLLHMSIRIRSENEDVGKRLYSEAGPDLCALGVPLSLRDYIQQIFNAQSHVCWDRWITAWQRNCTCKRMQNCEPVYQPTVTLLMISCTWILKILWVFTARRDGSYISTQVVCHHLNIHKLFYLKIEFSLTYVFIIGLLLNLGESRKWQKS